MHISSLLLHPSDPSVVHLVEPDVLEKRVGTVLCKLIVKFKFAVYEVKQPGIHSLVELGFHIVARVLWNEVCTQLLVIIYLLTQAGQFHAVFICKVNTEVFIQGFDDV